MTAGRLDSRVARMLWWLLSQDSPRAASELASDIGLTPRVVRYRFDALELALAARGLQLHRRRGTGIWVDGPAEAMAALRSELAGPVELQRSYTSNDRAQVLLATLLWASPDAVSMEALSEPLGASKTSLVRSLDWCETWLAQRRLALERRSGSQVCVAGDEFSLRSAMVAQIVGAVPAEVLDDVCAHSVDSSTAARMQIPAGMRDHLAKLPLRRCAAFGSPNLFGGALDENDSDHALAAYLAVATSRWKSGKAVARDVGRQHSVPDPEAADAAARIARDFGTSLGLDATHPEVAAATAYLMSLAAACSADPSPSHLHAGLAARMLDAASRRLSGDLAHDQQLRQNLLQHLERLAIRIRCGLPVHNPLLDEVISLYPEIHKVATELGADMSDHFGTPMTDDEIGFVTMYLSGALERSTTRRRPRRAVVICHSGTATAWVLVSRLQAEFPELELAAVAGVGALGELDLSDADVVVSTIALDLDACETKLLDNGDVDAHHVTIPVAVVSPLLTPDDVGVIASHL